MPNPADVVHSFAAVALSNITRAYPYAAHHVAAGPEDIVPASAKNPAFANSFDWHSSVHMHYLLVSLLGTPTAQDAGWRDEALAVLEQHLTCENLSTEAAFLRANPTWERPYGWAWSVELAEALRTSPEPRLAALSPAAEVLAAAVFDLTVAWLPKTPEPVRYGAHPNTAFGLRRILRAARVVGRDDVVTAVEIAARRFHLGDRTWHFDQERSGQDFLSPGLCEADLMVEVLSAEELSGWLPQFLGKLDAASAVLSPVEVLDPTDGYQSHLYGLGLSVAASVMRIAPELARIAETDHDIALGQKAASLLTTVDALMAPGLEAAVSDEYMASHWVATFAWEALTLRDN